MTYAPAPLPTNNKIIPRVRLTSAQSSTTQNCRCMFHNTETLVLEWGSEQTRGRHIGTRTTGQEREATEADIRPELIQYSVSRSRESHQMR